MSQLMLEFQISPQETQALQKGVLEQKQFTLRVFRGATFVPDPLVPVGCSDHHFATRALHTCSRKLCPEK
jgi:hypothetical protein